MSEKMEVWQVTGLRDELAVLGMELRAEEADWQS